MATHDLKETWLAGLRAADRVNRGEDLRGTACTCNEDTGKYMIHLCDRCSKSTRCSELSFRGNFDRWCGECEDKWLEDNKDSENNPSLRRMRNLTMDLLAHDEMKRRHEKSRSRRNVDPEKFEQCVPVLEPKLINRKKLVWNDGYSSNDRRDISAGKRQTGPYRQPFTPGIEAPFSYTEWQGE